MLKTKRPRNEPKPEILLLQINILCSCFAPSNTLQLLYSHTRLILLLLQGC